MPDHSAVVIESDSDGDHPISKSGRSVHFDAKVQRIDSLASELKEKHGDKFTIIQYKLWAEALDVNKHESKDVPPVGPIWNNESKKSKKSTSSESGISFYHYG